MVQKSNSIQKWKQFFLAAMTRETLGRQLEAAKVEQPGPPSLAFKPLLLREGPAPQPLTSSVSRLQGLPYCKSSHSVWADFGSQKSPYQLSPPAPIQPEGYEGSQRVC